MKKVVLKISCILFLVIPTISSFAQSGALDYELSFTRFWDNKLIYNPAYAGSERNLNLNVGARSQLNTISGAPLGIGVTADVGNKHFGLGITGTYYSYSQITNFGARVAGVYKFNLNKMSVNLGIDLGFLNKGFNYSNTGIKNSQSAFDLGAGIYLHHPNFYAGLSMTHIPQLRFSEIDDYFSVIRIANLMGGAKLRLGEKSNFSLEPNILVRYNFKHFSTDLNANLVYKQVIGVGFTYKGGAIPSNWGLQGLAVNVTGVLLNNSSLKLQLGYAYDFFLGSVAMQSNKAGIHEASLRISFKRKGGEGTSENPAPRKKKKAAEDEEN